MPKYIPFLRVSTKVQDTARQLADLTAYADKMNWSLTEPISETVSGGKKNVARAGIQAALKLARQGDTVLATEISRIGRDTAQVLLFMEELAERGVSVYILNLNLATLRPDGTRDPMAWAMLSVGAVFGALERAGLRERVQSGVDFAKSKGRVGGRPTTAVKTTAQLLMQYAGVAKRLESGKYTTREIATLEKVNKETVVKVRKAMTATVETDGA